MSTGGFSNPVAGGGGTLIRKDVHSENFVRGSTGWSIDQNGSAEFNDVTIRGNLSLPVQYEPVTSLYDASSGGTPAWNVTGSYVLFSGAAWGPIDMPAPSSGRMRWDLMILGLNNNTAASTLSVDLEVLESSSPGGDGFTPPGTQIHIPNIADAALVASFVAGSAAQPKSSAYFILDALTPDTWYRFRPYWRISSGSAATVAFSDLNQKFTVSPVI